MVAGRKAEYLSRTNMTIACEGAVKEEFQKICNRMGASMSEMVNQWMLNFVKEYQTKDYESMDNFVDPIQMLLPQIELPKKTVFTADLSQPIHHKEIIDFIHTLTKDEAARIQGIGKTCWSVGRLVVQQRKVGVAPGIKIF